MKRYITAIAAFVAVLALSSCNKETIEIDSLQVMGDEFYQGQKVQVGMAVNSSDPDNTYYEWWCEAGSFPSAMQGYPVNTWTAPKMSGEYTIGCNISCGNTKVSRQIKVRVTGLFFERFPGITLSGWTTTNQVAVARYGRMETLVSTTRADSLGFVSKSIGSSFAPPMSATADLGIVPSTDATPSYPITAPQIPGPPVVIKSWDNYMSVGITGSTPALELAPTYYMTEIAIQWWPAAHMKAQYDYFSADDPVTPKVKDASEFNVALAISWTRRGNVFDGIAEQKGVWTEFFNVSELTFDAGTTKNVAFSLDENYLLKIFVDKQEAVSTDVIALWRTTKDNASFYANAYKYLYPAKARVYMDNIVVNNATELLY